MIQKIPEKTNQPLDLITYLLRPDKGYVIGNTFVTNPPSPQALNDELSSYREINPWVKHLVSHMSLRLAPGEHLSDAQFQVIAADYLQGLGYGDCAYFVVRHTDAASEHIHIVVSRIARDGHCVSDSFDWPRGERLVRTFERRYGLRQVPSSDEVLRQSLTRGELALALRHQEPSARQALQEIVAQAAGEARDFPDFVERLAVEEVSLLVHLDREGRLHGYSYELEGYAMSGTQLGRGFTLRGIERGYGIVPRPEAHAGLLARLGRPSESAADSSAVSEPSGDPLASLRSEVRDALAGATSFEAFADRLAASGIRLEVQPDSLGRPHGLVYEAKNVRAAASSLGRDFTLGALKRRGLIPGEAEVSSADEQVRTPPPSRSREEVSAELLRTVDRVAATSADFRTFREELLTCGIRLEAHYSERGRPTGLTYHREGFRWAGNELGSSYTLGGLKKTRGLAPEPDPVLREASRRALTELAHQAARPGSPPTFTQFGEALEARGVNLRLYTKDGEPMGLAYRYKEETFAARALGPELTLRGLRAYFEIPIADSDRAYVNSISTESTRETPPPDDTEIRETLTPMILAAASSSEDASEFLVRLEEQGIHLRLYLSAEGQPRRLAYEYEQTFYTPKQLGAEVDLPNLVRNHGLTFDPIDDSPVFELCGVPLAKNAAVSRTDFVPWVAEAVAAAAADGPGLPELVERLSQADIKLHLLTPANDPTHVVGISYEHKDLFVSARSLGPEYTFSGLQTHFQVDIDPVRDEGLIHDLSKALPETPPADPRDVWEEVRDRLTLVATEAEDFGTYVARLEQSGIHPILRVDDTDRLVGITYRVAGRELRDQQLGPDFTPAGLHQAFGLAPQPSDRDRIGANVVREDEWTRILAGRLEIAAGQKGTVQRYAAQSLRRDPIHALRTVANAQYLLSAAVNPRLAARAAMARLPAGRLLNDALSFAAAFRSPVAATVFGLRIASRGFAAAAKSRQPEVPTFDAVARQILQPFLAAAREGAPSAAVFAHRLRLAGIEPQVVVEASKPTLYYQLADHVIPATDLGNNYTLAAIARHHGEDHATTAAALDPLRRTDLPRPHPIGRRPDSGPDRSPDRPHPTDGEPPAGPTRRAEEPGGAPARHSSPEHHTDLTPSGEPAVAPTGDPHLTSRARGVADPHPPAPELARTAGEPQPSPPTAIIADAADAARPPADVEAVKRHLDALQCDRLDLRIDSPGALPAFYRGLSREQLAASIQQIWQGAPPGATIGVRPTADPGVQLLRDLTPEQISQASRRGFQPALTVETTPGRFDVWVRHLAPGAEAAPPEVLNYARRAVRMEYGQPSAKKDGAYGRLAGIHGTDFTPRLAHCVGTTYGRAGEYIHLLAGHRLEAQAALQAALERFHLPSPRDFHSLNPTLSRRESDLLWAQRAHANRLPAHHVLSALAAGRERAHEPQSALRYASNLYSVMLRDFARLSPAAAQAATLRGLSVATGAPVMLLRLALGIARPILRIFRP